MSLAFVVHNLGFEGPRELLIGVACGVGVTLALSKVGHLFHRKAQAERRAHHEETMAMHRKTHTHLGIDP